MRCSGMAADLELFQNLLATTPDAILVVERNGRIVIANASAETMFGYEPGELAGQTIETLVPQHYRERHAGLRATFHQQGSSRPMGTGRPIHGMCKDGTVIPLDVQLTPLEHNGERFVAAIARDIRHLEALQSELARFATRLEQALAESESQRAQLVALNEEKSRLLGLAAHDLRSPLTAMALFAELLESGALASVPDELQPLVHTISRNVDYMSTLVDEMLDFSAVDAGALVLRPVSTDVTAVVTAALAAERINADARGVVLASRFEDVGTHVVDPAKLEQIVHNLVGNAIRFSPTGGRVALTVERTPDGLRLSVRDSGPGVPDEIRPTLFRPFVRAAGQAEKGTGLGLAIVRRIAEGHGGTVRLEDPEDGGARFVVELPLEHAAT